MTNMKVNKEIEQMQKIICNRCGQFDGCSISCKAHKDLAEALYNAGYRKLPEDSVVLSREEYEKLKSLYDTQKVTIMTSAIGDLPLTVAGLRKAVDEITRLNKVEAELQELNMKYYNEAKDLRRKLKEYENEQEK